jgi:hypothetical protein
MLSESMRQEGRMRSIGVAAVIAAVIFPAIYLTIVSLTGEVRRGSIVVALVGGVAFAMVSGLIGAVVQRSRQR